MWQCDKCGRSFKKTNQTHSCKTYTEEAHLQNRDEKIKKLYSTLLKRIHEEVGSYAIDPVECCIHLVTQTTFLAVKPQKSALKVSFVSKESIPSKRIIKEEFYSTHRMNNIVKVTKEEEINKELIGWIQSAYELSL